LRVTTQIGYNSFLKILNILPPIPIVNEVIPSKRKTLSNKGLFVSIKEVKPDNQPKIRKI
jgi:hypothetical protein